MITLIIIAVVILASIIPNLTYAQSSPLPDFRTDSIIQKSGATEFRFTQNNWYDAGTSSDSIITRNTSNRRALIAPLAMIVGALGFTPYSNANPSGYRTQSQVRTDISLTNTGSGAASYTSGTGVLNIPTPAALSITADTLSSSRSFNTAYAMSSTKYVEVCISAQVSASLSLTGGQGGTITLQTSPTGSVWTDKGSIVGSNTGALTIGLSTVQVTGGQVCAVLPPTYVYRMATTNNTGTPTFTNLTGNKNTYN